MSIFSDYAIYYNLLYQDKDYCGEAKYAFEIFTHNGCKPKTLLDLGCGTGRHALEMARHAISVTGIDLSKSMLDIGIKMLSEQNPADFPVALPNLLHGDARSFRLQKKFDAVISLFHVMSYQNTEADTLLVMQTAKEHLNPGGLFFFDFWYGPGVLTDPPTKREKIIEDNKTKVIRLATPVHKVNDNIVEVHYNVSLINKKTRLNSSLCECHSMRYWFLPELCYLANQSGFSVITSKGWLTNAEPTTKTWNACLLLKKSD